MQWRRLVRRTITAICLIVTAPVWLCFALSIGVVSFVGLTLLSIAGLWCDMWDSVCGWITTYEGPYQTGKRE